MADVMAVRKVAMTGLMLDGQSVEELVVRLVV